MVRVSERIGGLWRGWCRSGQWFEGTLARWNRDAGSTAMSGRLKCWWRLGLWLRDGRCWPWRISPEQTSPAPSSSTWRAPYPEVTTVTNQSTGYCPEPGSWLAVAAALDRIAVPHPGRFTDEFAFRRCPRCGETNPVREDDCDCGTGAGQGWHVPAAA